MAFKNNLSRYQDALIRLLVSPEWLSTHPEMLEMWETRKENPIPIYAQRLHYQASENHDAWDALSAIKAPTLVIHGSEDQFMMTANATLLAERIPQAELYLVEGGRHLFFREFQAEASRMVLDFLAKHPLGQTRYAPSS